MPPKKVKTTVKLQVPAGKATPAPPIGTALGPHGVNIGEFVNQFNTATRELGDTVVPCIITIFEDRSFTFIMKTPPVPNLLKKAAGIETASGEPNKKKVGSVTRAQVEEIAKIKMPDLNSTSLEGAMRQVEGTARSMGIDVK